MLSPNEQQAGSVWLGIGKASMLRAVCKLCSNKTWELPPVADVLSEGAGTVG
jgi:hypothetical protein